MVKYAVSFLFSWGYGTNCRLGLLSLSTINIGARWFLIGERLPITCRMLTATPLTRSLQHLPCCNKCLHTLPNVHPELTYWVRPYVKLICGHGVGEEGGMSWETGIDMCALITSGKPLNSTGSLAQCSVMTQRGRMGWGGPRRRGYMYAIADSLHCTTL